MDFYFEVLCFKSKVLFEILIHLDDIFLGIMQHEVKWTLQDVT